MANEKRLIWDEDAKRHLIALATGHHTETLHIDMILDAILHHTPTVDAVEVVHGRWLSAYEYALKLGVTDKDRLEEAKKNRWWKFCNDCNQQVKGFHNYCPNCGAKMDGGNHREEM